MKKNISLLLAAILIGGIYPQVSFGLANPLKSYDLYSDTHSASSPRDNVMSEMYYTDNAQNSPSRRKIQSKPPKAVPTTQTGEVRVNVDIPQRRNVYLRESSRKVFGSGSGEWTKGPYFYDTPTLESIKEKYRLSNFAGCMQECEAYVKQHPNDTLGYYYLAMSYAKCGQKGNAILAYEKVISLHDNPMIVKYATNGRNCVMGNEDEAKCFQRVNEPDLYYPYREMAKEIGLTPVDPQDLIDKSFAQLSDKFSKTGTVVNNEENANTIKLPFENQDDSLDRFIQAPYGTGLSPELEREFKLQQLKNIQNDINSEDKNNPGKYYENIRNIKEFDADTEKKSENEETIKLALADNMDVADIFNSPEYIQNKKELDEIKMMFGDYGTQSADTDMTNLLPQLAQDNKNISPELVQMMMMQSVMPNIIDTSSKSGF